MGVNRSRVLRGSRFGSAAGVISPDRWGNRPPSPGQARFSPRVVLPPLSLRGPLAWASAVFPAGCVGRGALHNRRHSCVVTGRPKIVFPTRVPPVRRPPSPASRKRAQSGDLRLPGPAQVSRPPLRVRRSTSSTLPGQARFSRRPHFSSRARTLACRPSSSRASA